jgi:hypothetical protein
MIWLSSHAENARPPGACGNGTTLQPRTWVRNRNPVPFAHPARHSAMCRRSLKMRRISCGASDRLRGDDIPLLASVVSVVDACRANHRAALQAGVHMRTGGVNFAKSAPGWKHQESVEGWIDLQYSGDCMNSAEET